MEIHKDEKVYVPELIFGHLLTSSNYNDSQKKVRLLTAVADVLKADLFLAINGNSTSGRAGSVSHSQKLAESKDAKLSIRSVPMGISVKAILVLRLAKVLFQEKLNFATNSPAMTGDWRQEWIWRQAGKHFFH